MFSHIGTLRHRTVTTPPITGGVVQIGTGSTRNYGQIIDGESSYSKAGVIWTAAELGAAKTITQVDFYFRSYTTPYTMTSQVIKMALVDQATFAASPDMSFSDLTLSGLITVKNSFNLTIGSNNTWYSFVFDTPFVYDGVKNLLLIWENNDGSWSVGQGGTDGSTVANTVAMKSSGTIPITGVGTRISNRPNIKIHY